MARTTLFSVSMTLVAAVLAVFLLAAAWPEEPHIVSHDTFSVARGVVPGIDYELKYGTNPDVDTARETLWICGGLGGGQDNYPWATLDTPRTLYGSSTVAGDTGLTIQMRGLDADWNMQTETITTNGQTAVAFPGTWRRVNRVRNISTSQTTLQGNLYIHVDPNPTGGIPGSTTDTVACIIDEIGTTLQLVYTCPADYRECYITGAAFGRTRSGTGDADYTVRFRQNGANATPWTTAFVVDAAQGPVVIGPFPGRTDLEVRPEATANNTPVWGFVVLRLVE